MLTPLYRGPAETRWRTGSKVENGGGRHTEGEGRSKGNPHPKHDDIV